MKIRFILLYGILFLVLQCVIMPTLGWRNIKPDLLMILVVFIAMAEEEPEKPVIAGFILGLLEDAFSSVPLGGFALSKSLAALVAHFLAKRLFPDYRWVHLLGAAAGLAVQNIVLYFIMVVMSDRVFVLENLGAVLLIETGFTLMVYAFLFGLLSRLHLKHGGGVFQER
ncbi:rod shape-determining protein MreD [bacterium]|nr:rod shape-determining protein MreD [candidate division CSSED10-310 bacterium]